MIGIFPKIRAKEDDGLLQNAFFSSSLFKWDYYTS